MALFFIVSGFIFWWITAGRTPRPLDFILRRAARLVPLYWVATLLLALKSHVDASAHGPVALSDLVQSLLFIPHIDGRAGTFFPILFPGWTLVYEFFFCLLFTALLFVGEKARLVLLTGVLGALAAIGLVMHPTGPVLETYTNQIVLEFLAGVWAARLMLTARPPIWLSGLLFVAGFVLSFHPGARYGPAFELVASGGPALLLVIGAVGLERLLTRPVRWLSYVGDSSYSIYIWHIPAALVSYWLCKRLSIPDGLLGTVMATVAGIGAGLVLYPLLERPMTTALFRWLDGRKRARRSPVATPTPSPASLPTTAFAAPELPATGG